MKPSRLFLFSRYLEPVLPLWGSWISLKESGADPETANTWEVRRIGSDQRAAVLVASGRVIWLHRTGYVWRKKNCFAIEIHQLQEWLAPEPLCWLLSLEHDQQFQWNWKSYLFQLVPERKKKKKSPAQLTAYTGHAHSPEPTAVTLAKQDYKMQPVHIDVTPSPCPVPRKSLCEVFFLFR